MKLKCTALRSYVMTAKPSQRGNDDSELLKFKDFQGPLTSNSKTFKALFHFQRLSRSWKNGNMFSRTFKNFQGRVATLKHYKWMWINGYGRIISASSSKRCRQWCVPMDTEYSDHIIIIIIIISGLHHYECVASLVANSLQSGRFWARSTASVHDSPWESRSFCTVFI